MAKAKRIKGINCDEAAVLGIRLVLETRFDEMYNFRQAALDWSDPEGVHSMRVASRRLRSALRDFMPYLRQRGLTSVLKHTKSIAAALGEVRDQDVAIIALEKVEEQAPGEAGAALKQLIDEHKELRNEARETLSSVLVEKQLNELRSEFMARIHLATRLRKAGDGGELLTFSNMAGNVIQDRLKELEKLSDSLYNPFEVEPLHDMRIAAKRLRYALELFHECWDRSLQTYAKDVARIQTALGDVHDCDIWLESLGKHVNEARKQKQDEQIVGFIWLLSHFVKVRTKHLRQAYDLWREWEADDMGEQVREAIR
jgi:CHAD domain-containing protein